MKKSTAAIFILFWVSAIWSVPNRFAATSANFSTPEIAPAAVRIELEPVITAGLSSPVLLTNAHDGSNRLFIVEQTGRIKVLQPNASTPTVFLDVASKIVSGGERGLLGLTFHPDFINNRRFFINYTRQGDGATVIAEYQASLANPNVAETNEIILLTIAQPFANHNGGMVEFGADKFLYIGMGDGGSANDPDNRAQNIEDLLGKILRIDVDHPNGQSRYSAPSDNPFFGATAGRDEIFAYGLRNPWRFSFDRLTGELYAADVGQGAVEEIDLITRGGNYGWRVWEGTRCTNNSPTLCSKPGFIAPLFEYSHADERCSITGGYVYRGTKSSLPAGAYVYGDYCSGEIFLLIGTAPQLLLDTRLNISSFGEDEAGEIYVVGLGGTVQRIKNPEATPPPPNPVFTILSAVLRRRSSGEIIQPVTVKPNGKKFELVVRESAAAPLAQSNGANLYVNGVPMNTEYITNETGAPIFVARLRRATLAQAGTLLIEVVRADGSRSNQLSLQVLAAAQ
ncbi:MAG: PQQ-dependent sugar dehydrogenase [Acidobacteria bacterium]|nr:PQQ-dependent sugar dehydrogenase [Acidobacteriota bacterium]